MQLYQFYLPDELPEFDSYRVISITADVECLLKRIAALVPSHCNPGDMFNMTLIFIREGNLVGKHIPRGGLHTARELHVAHRYHWHSSRAACGSQISLSQLASCMWLTDITGTARTTYR